MRAHLSEELVDARVNVAFSLRVTVQNDTPEIRRVGVHIPMLPPLAYAASPTTVSIFPDEVAEIDLTITLPRDTPAGPNRLDICLVDELGQTVVVQCVVDVAPVDHIDLTVTPRAVTGGRRAVVVATVENRGNRPTSISVSAADPDRRLKYSIQPRRERLSAHESQAFRVVATGRRPLWGMPRVAAVTVMAESRSQRESRVVTFQSNPYLSRGLLTVFVLISILALWVVVFSAGFRAVLAGQQVTKAAPADFSAGRKPDPAISVGSISGRVLAASDGRPLPRLVVTATPREGDRPPTAASTDEDGAYLISGLAPGRYRVTVSGEGFRSVKVDGEWRIRPGDVVKIDETFAVGVPARITGKVMAAGAGLKVAIEARLMDGDVPGSFSVRARSNKRGDFEIPELQSPARYRLTFTAKGFEPLQLFQSVSPGEALVMPTVQMTSGPGEVTGIVVDQDGIPIGGAEVTATSGSSVLKTVTGTAGPSLGAFVLGELPSPATYLVQVALEGYGTQTFTVTVGPGQSVALADPIVLSRGTGVVSGVVTDVFGRPLGGVTITASNGLVVASSTSVDADGGYLLRGLPVPGSYTITFELAGYATEVIAVKLTADEGLKEISVQMRSESASAIGIVVDGTGRAVGGLTVVASSGSLSVTSLTTDPSGGFRLDGLAPGWWTLTFGESAAPQAVLLSQIAAGVNDVGQVVLDD